MSYQTYVEQQGKTPFDWFHFLRKDNRTDQEWEAAHELSCNWVTCACGNQCSIIPRDNEGQPLDPDLSIMGLDFVGAIADMDTGLGLEILCQIERRSFELIRQIETGTYE